MLLQVELSDQDDALLFVFGNNFVCIYDQSSSDTESVHFDQRMLGGGRVQDYRGCFYVSEDHGVLCARLARAGIAHPSSLRSPLPTAPASELTASSSEESAKILYQAFVFPFQNSEAILRRQGISCDFESC